MLDLPQNSFVGVHALRKELAHLLKRVQDDGQDIVVTHQGKPAAVLLNIEKYLEMRDALRDLSDPQHLQELIAAKREFDEGKGIPAEQVYREAGLG